MNKNLRENGSGYYDPTVYKAIKYRDEELEHNYNRERLAGRLVKNLQNLAHMVGFEIVGRIQLRDKESGDIYK